MALTTTSEDRENPFTAARNALALLPVGASADAMRKAVASSLKPLEDEIEARAKREQLRHRADEEAARFETLLLVKLGEF